MKGIYKITSTKTGRIYIGKSVDLEKRFPKHLLLLRKNKHWNQHIQRVYNKYGEKDLVFSIIEECDNISNDDLLKREIYWIKEMEAFDGKNFNQTLGGETGSNSIRNRKIQLKNIKTGEIKLFESLAQAGRELNISPSDIHRLLDSERINRLKDWTRIDCEYSNRKKTQKEYTLYHDLYGAKTFYNVTQFARDIQVAAQPLFNLLNGKFKNIKGWRTTVTKVPRKNAKKIF